MGLTSRLLTSVSSLFLGTNASGHSRFTHPARASRWTAAETFVAICMIGAIREDRMLRPCEIVRWRTSLAVVGCAVFCLAAIASAQNACPKDEVFGGYSWLAPNGWGDLDYKINNIPNAFDASNTFYRLLSRICGLIPVPGDVPTCDIGLFP